MKITDLSHVISSRMPLYPGSATPEIKTLYDVEKDGFMETEFTLSSHTGTHIDALFYMLEEGAKLAEYEIEKFFGKALIVDCTHLQKDQIEADDLLGAQRRMDETDFVIIKTGWSRFWGTPGYMERYPVLSIEAAQLIAENELKGIGLDSLSIDVVSTDRENVIPPSLPL